MCVWLIRPNLSQHVRRYENCVRKLHALSPRCVRAQRVTRCSIPSTSCRCRCHCCCCCYYYYCQCRGLLSSALHCTLLTSLRSVPFRSDTIASELFRSDATAAAATDEDDNSELMCQVRVVPRMKQFIALSALRCFASCSLSVAVSVPAAIPVFVCRLTLVAVALN